MIDLVVIETDDIPKDALDWHNKGYTHNTIFLSIMGPHPLTGVFTGKLYYTYKFSLHSCNYWYIDKRNGNPINCYSFSLYRVPRKLRKNVVKLNYKVVTKRYTQRVDEHGVVTKFYSEQALKEFILSEKNLTLLKEEISDLIESPTISYKGTL